MSKLFQYFILFTIIGVILSGCAAPVNQNQVTAQDQLPTDTPDNIKISQPNITTTPLPKRPQYSPGELVDYIAQTGDSLASIASHFNSSVQEILTANTFIPADASTMPPGMPMKIPIYYQPFWGTQYQILPDSLFINGPAQVGFDTTQFVEDHSGWLKSFSEYAFNDNRTGAEIINYVALNYSVSPRVLLEIMFYPILIPSILDPTDLLKM